MVKMQEQTIFDLMYPRFVLNKPIRLIELFAGIGSQATAMKRLGLNFESWRICEWAVKSILAYKNLHSEDEKDYSQALTREELIETLYQFGISSDYNQPMTKAQIELLKDERLREIYNAIKSTNNLVNIQNVKAEDLDVRDTDIYIYIYAFIHSPAKI